MSESEIETRGPGEGVDPSASIEPRNEGLA
jgi:hypothetical protein